MREHLRRKHFRRGHYRNDSFPVAAFQQTEIRFSGKSLRCARDIPPNKSFSKIFLHSFIRHLTRLSISDLQMKDFSFYLLYMIDISPLNMAANHIVAAQQAAESVDCRVAEC